MPTNYYVRKTGNDSNAGTSAGAAWRTLSKAFGTSGIASGDTLFIGAGVYRETISITMVSPTVETKIIGDVDGLMTGDAGEVRWTGYTTHDRVAGSGTTPLSLNNRDFLTFEKIVFVTGAAGCITAAAGSTNITFRNCAFFNGDNTGRVMINFTGTVDVTSFWVVDKCLFFAGNTNAITITLPTSTVADYDVNFIIKNCIFLGAASTCVGVTTSGGNSFKGGGVTVINCTSLRGTIMTTAANNSSTFPCFVYNCYIFSIGVTAINANTLGQIIEDYNIIQSTTARTNIAIGPHSVSNFAYPNYFSIGQESFIGLPLKPYGSFYEDSPYIGFGSIVPVSGNDILGNDRPQGTTQLKAEGTITNVANYVLNSAGQNWGSGDFAGKTLKITEGAGKYQTKSISNNSATGLVLDGAWETVPAAGGRFVVYQGQMSTVGVASTANATNIIDSGAAWGANMWRSYAIQIMSGTASGEQYLISGNEARTIHLQSGITWTTTPDNTSLYHIYRESGIGTGIHSVGVCVGAYEVVNVGIKETGVVKTGPNSLRIIGQGYHDFDIPVSGGVSNTVGISGYYDDLYTGTLPQLKILNGSEIQVNDNTGTMTAASGTWQGITVSFVPSGNGVVTARLVSNSTGNLIGSAFFDDFSVT